MLLKQTTPLLAPFSHPYALKRVRGLLIISRIQQIAIVFSLMTIGWIAVDIVLLPWPLWKQLAIGRIITCIIFFGLGKINLKSKPDRALLLLVSVYAIILIFLFFAAYSMQEYVLNQTSAQYAAIYYFSPFALAASIAFFPLTLLEAVFLLAVPIVTAMFLYIGMFQTIMSDAVGYQVLWTLALTLVTSAVASMSQMGFLLGFYRDMAYDKLTGLPLRKIGETTLNQVVAIAIRNNFACSILLLDLDNFKKINDSFGHETGDLVLSTVGERLKNTLRQQDVAVRWGGEEFLIALPNANKEQAEIFLKRFAIAGLGTAPDGTPISASFGIAEVNADQEKNLHALIALADTRLYAAKRAGRNCYVMQNTACLWLNPPVNQFEATLVSQHPEHF